ncbi:hypothetical protein D046_3816, partial [Vibrio parahaemolyticus V-223/04]|jgi:hypothetical protein
LIE